MMDSPVSELRSAHLDLIDSSLVSQDDAEYGLARVANTCRLIVLASSSRQAEYGFGGQCSEFGDRQLLVGALTAHNAAQLRHSIAWLRPRPLGLQTSAGMGDRLGLATPGHIRALRAVQGSIAPVFAQQSIREMARTHRTAQQVMDDATWAVFAEGWREGVGADADHLKTTDDIDTGLAAGFTFFTIDPGAYVDNRAGTADLALLHQLAMRLPHEVQPRLSGLRGRAVKLETRSVEFDETTLLRAAVKYGAAVAHMAAMYRHLESSAGDRPFELEVSVDETQQPTSHAEHVYLASELKRLGVHWVSLAPRFVGRFEKGVDYIGDVEDFEADIAGHAEIARLFGPYKLSLHSGSDKFSIYPAAARQTRGLVHLKTAGTSYLEALRTVAMEDPVLLREIYVFARQRYEVDRASYHVSADVARSPEPAAVIDWVALLDQFDAREILHVTFGSVLTEPGTKSQFRFRDRLLALLRSKPDLYAENLARHFVRHLEPFAVREVQ